MQQLLLTTISCLYPRFKNNVKMKDLKELLTPEEFAGFGLDKASFIPVKDLLTTTGAHGLALPSPLAGLASRDLPSRVYALAGAQIGHLLGGRLEESKAGQRLAAELLRVSIGRLLGETLDHLEDRARSASRSQPQLQSQLEAGTGVRAPSAGGLSAGGQRAAAATMRLLSGHDTTVVPVLAALGAYDDHWPPYASFVAFELWGPRSGQGELGGELGIGGEPMVRVLFNGEPVKVRGVTWAPAEAPEDVGLMRLSEFISALRPLVPTDVEAECRPSAGKTGPVSGEGDKFV